jgi:hypothetical protein
VGRASDWGGGAQGIGGASGRYNSLSGLQKESPITANAIAARSIADTTSGPLGVLGKMLGVGWMDPTEMNRKALMSGVPGPTVPDTGFDALGAALGLGGAFSGLPLGTGYGVLKALGVVPRDVGMVDLGNWGRDPLGGLFGGGLMGGGSGSVPGAGGGPGNPGNWGNSGNWGGLGGLGGVPSASGQPGDAGAPGSSPGTPAAAAAPATAAAPPAQSLVPLMSQASPDMTGSRFGPVPDWATTPYQIGTIPSVNQPPAIPGTPFAAPATPPAGGGNGGGGTGGTGRLANWQQAILAAYPQYAGIIRQMWGRRGLVA